MSSQKNSDPVIGQRFGNFLIQQPLGRGGMARVYKGLDTTLKRPVAIKVIAEGLRNESYTRRFELEAQAVAGLKHPNIVTVFQFGQQGDLYYLVMEYIDGTDLDAIMRNYENNGELMPHADIIRILSVIASALDYAHSQGVIHRDVKPSNIMLERDGRPVLTDFGLALRVNEGTAGEVFGSPHYISPEQARNSGNAVAQSDLYSLGIIAYELLTGVVPFDDPSPTALVMQHILAPVPPLRAMNRDLSEEVEGVLFKILAKAPTDRYTSGQEFMTALGGALERLSQRRTGKVATADLPPLPPGVMPPPPRRLSMQTAHDKLIQEIALTQAKGQALTYLPKEETPKKQRRVSLLPVILIVAVVLVIGYLFIRFSTFGGRGLAAMSITTPTLGVTKPTDTIAPVIAVTTILPPPTDTFIPTITQPMTILPTTAVPTIIPTIIATPTTPPTQTPNQAPAQPITPTVLYPDGRLFVFVWDATAFYMANAGTTKVTMGTGTFTFDRLTTSGSAANHFDAQRWAWQYPYSYPKQCMILYLQGKGWHLPPNDCPLGINSEVSSNTNEIFWTPDANSTVFSVSWAGQKVGRCVISQPRCEIRIPKA